MKNIICLIAVVLILIGCSTPKPILLTEYTTLSIPQELKDMPEVPRPPSAEEFSKLDPDFYTTDYKKQRDMLKDYSIALLAHIHTLRTKLISIIDYTDKVNKGISNPNKD